MSSNSPTFLMSLTTGTVQQMSHFLDYCQPRTVCHEDLPPETYECSSHSPESYWGRFNWIARVPNEGTSPKGNLQSSDLQVAFWHSLARVTSLVLGVIGYFSVIVGQLTIAPITFTLGQAIATVTPYASPTLGPILVGLSAEQLVYIGATCCGVAMVILAISIAILKDEAFLKFSQPVDATNTLDPVETPTTKEDQNKWFSGYSFTAFFDPVTMEKRSISIYETDKTEISRVHQLLRIIEVALIGIVLLGATALVIDAMLFPIVMLPITHIDAYYFLGGITAVALAIHVLVQATLDELVPVRKEDLQVTTKNATSIDLYHSVAIASDSYIKRSDLREVNKLKTHLFLTQTI